LLVLRDCFFLPLAAGIVLVVPAAVGVSILIGLLALPLCGAALTFFAAAAKKVSKESGLKPPILKRLPWLGGCSGPVEIEPAHLPA
jgi:hypothetical protein